MLTLSFKTKINLDWNYNHYQGYVLASILHHDVCTFPSHVEYVKKYFKNHLKF